MLCGRRRMMCLFAAIYFIACFLLACCMYMYHHESRTHSHDQTGHHFLIEGVQKLVKNSKNVTILMWTNYYQNKDLVDHIRLESPIPSWCNVTFDRKQINHSDALVFHAFNDDFDLKNMPTRRTDQPWVFFLLEAPAYMNTDFDSFDGLFNRTMSYRLDSDYPCPYGYVTRREHRLKSNPFYTDPTFPRKKTKLVAWMVSHCITINLREELVRKLQKYIDVDIYGSCGQLYCDPTQEEGCYQKLGETYKFYLAFENSLCTDYITEKFSNALRYNMVPVVYGGGNYSALVPHRKSFINVADFRTMNQLADYLQYLDRNESAYAEYFEWRQIYKIHIRQGFGGFRRMCYALLNEQKTQTYHHMSDWWTTEGNCSRKSHPATEP